MKHFYLELETRESNCTSKSGYRAGIPGEEDLYQKRIVYYWTERSCFYIYRHWTLEINWSSFGVFTVDLPGWLWKVQMKKTTSEFLIN